MNITQTATEVTRARKALDRELTLKQPSSIRVQALLRVLDKAQQAHSVAVNAIEI